MLNKNKPSTVCEKNTDEDGNKVRFNIRLTKEGRIEAVECNYFTGKNCLKKVEKNKKEEEEQKIIPEDCHILGKNYLD